MKYIVLTDGNNEFMFTMPRNALLTHEKFAEAVGGYRCGPSHDWERSFRKNQTVSAGFISNGKTHGESLSLGLKSRDEDQQLYNDMWIS